MKIYYIKDKDLLIVQTSNTNLSYDSKQRMKEELSRETGIKNILVLEGEFEYIG